MEKEPVIKHYAVLVCDDDDEYRVSQVRMLNLFNWSNRNISFGAYGVATVNEAMDLMDEKEIDCVLLDYAMPDQNGVETMRKMLEKYPELAVVLVTGAGDENIAVHAMKEGAMDYLKKGGITIELMERTIVNSVTRAKMQHQLELQSKELLHVEQHRVMIQSLAAACHHLAQPVTVLRTYILLLKRKAESEESHHMLTEAYKALELMTDILWKLNHLDKYSTEPYLEGESDSAKDSVRMVKIEN